MKRLGQALSAVTWLLIVCSVVIITGGLFGRPLLLAAVPTGSMVPVLRPGDLIVVLPTWVMPATEVGDIVVYRTAADQDWIVHRVIDGSEAEGFVMKGDANPTPDSPRVFPRDMAGVVPQWDGAALRFPRLGLLSLSEGPLSNPLVAGAALLMGIYLLVMDVNPRKGGGRLRLRRIRARPAAVLSLYVGLSVTVFITTLIPIWTLSSRQVLEYRVVEQQPAHARIANQFVVGRPFREEVVIENPSPLPLVVTFASDDPHVRYSPSWAVLAPHSAKSFEAIVANPQVGEHKGTLSMGVFLPLLPPHVLGSLTRSSLLLSAMVCAGLPAATVLLVGMFDRQVHAALARWRLLVQLRVGL